MTDTAYPPHRIEVALEWAESCVSRADYMVAAVDGDRIEITHNQVTLARALYEKLGPCYGQEDSITSHCDAGGCSGGDIEDEPALVDFVDTVEAMRRLPRSAAE